MRACKGSPGALRAAARASAAGDTRDKQKR